ncbi:histidine kinase [Gramella sp. BOM4]|nr:histidine kinase [Christiangramia bathymodioli]
MPNNTVRSLLVDSNNILWIGTDNGVVRKQNDVFREYFEEDGLAMNSCWAIAEDKNGNIWLGSYGGGLSIYDGEKFRVISRNKGLVNNEVTRLFPAGDHMYVGTSDGLSRVNIHNFKVDSWCMHPADDLFRVTGFLEYENEIYITTYNTGIYKIPKNKHDDLVKISDHEYIYSVFRDKDGIYSSNKGFFSKTSIGDYLEKNDRVSSEKLGSSILWDYVKTKNEQIFTAAWGIYDTNGGIYEIKDDKLIARGDDFSIPSKKIISLAYDKEFDKLYAGSLDAGLFEVQLDPQVQFHEIMDRDVLGFSFSEEHAAVLLTDGIFLKNKNGTQIISLEKLKQWQEAYLEKDESPHPEPKESFYELDHSTPAKDISFYDIKYSEDAFWINTNIGIFVIQPSGKLQRYIPLHSEEINFSSKGRLIETHPYGGARVYSNLDAFEYRHFLQEDPETPTMVVNSLKTEDRTYFLSVFSGLYVWENGNFRSYLKEGIWQEEKLRHITRLEDHLAISTEFGDVYIINDHADFKILKKIPRARIEGNTISFLKNYEGSLLIGTEKGLNIYKNGRFIFLNEEQGLEQPFFGAEVNHNFLSIGSSGGFYQINLDKFEDPQSLISDLQIKEVYVNNQEFPVDRKGENEKIRLEHDENTVLFKFSTNSHPYPKKLSYQYRLNDREEWSLPSPKPEVFLPFLPSKNYDLSVKVTDHSTGLSYDESLAQFAILPPFWRTWWFSFLVFSSILLIILGIYKYQLRQKLQFEEQKRLIQQRFEETRMEALLAQMNPHFIFNAMNSIQNYIMDSDIDNASIFLGDFAKLIRLNLDHCTKPRILLVEEIEYLQSYIRVENSRFDDSINVEMHIDPAIDTYEVEIPTMILQTFVENVFVHAFPDAVKNPRLKICFELHAENVLKCIIEDNGIGYSPGTSKSMHDSKGVKLVRERLALLGYDLEEALQVKTSKKEGTKVTISLKV